MIQFTRALARQLRAVLKRSVWAAAPRGTRPPVVLCAERDGLRVHSYDPEVALEFHQPGMFSPEVLALPGEALEDFEGRADSAVTLEAVGRNSVQARWDDAGVPQVRDYPARDPESLPAFLKSPEQWATVEPGFLKALADAADVAAREHPRYALRCTQLRGAGGQVIATDGAQMLLQAGFALPWSEDLLIPSVAAFACKELPQDAPVAVGKTDAHVVVRAGPWTFWLAIDKEGRYPHADSVVPAQTKNGTTCRLAPEDAEFLLRVLPRLPGGKEEHGPVTLDLTDHAIVRACGDGQPRSTEVVLSRSAVSGPAVRLVCNRRHLGRAVQLGFAEFSALKPDAPVVARDGSRTYVWMTLDKSLALPPSTDTLRITSQPEKKTTCKPRIERRTVAMSSPSSNGGANGHAARRVPHAADQAQPAPGGLATLIQEAEDLKALLHDAYGRSARLVAGLKRHRQQSRQVSQALASLRQLQQLAPAEA